MVTRKKKLLAVLVNSALKKELSTRNHNFHLLTYPSSCAALFIFKGSVILSVLPPFQPNLGSALFFFSFFCLLGRGKIGYEEEERGVEAEYNINLGDAFVAFAP